MTKTELISELAEAAKLTKTDAEKALNAFMAIVEKTLAAGDEINLIGFGKFSTTLRKATTGRNPKTGAELQIPERIVPRFKSGKPLRDAVNKA